MPATPQDPTRFLGLDLGRERNHTALAVLERTWHQATLEQLRLSSAVHYSGEFQYRVVGADRLSLGTPYPQVVQWVKRKAEEHKQSAVIAALVVDATGVGSAILDYLKAANLGLRIIPTVITGTQYSSPAGIAGLTNTGEYTLSRSELLTSLQLAIQAQRLFIDLTQCRESEALCRELSLLRHQGKRPGVQDDLAFALALTVWWGMQKFARNQLVPR